MTEIKSNDNKNNKNTRTQEHKNTVLLAHGSGGRLSHQLIRDLFAKHFDNDYLRSLSDSAEIDLTDPKIAFTTDSYVVKPLTFPGGNIGKLAICGTVNDLAVAGATPLFISCGFIIEEGISFELLEEIVSSMAKTALDAGVQIVTGDTKVVEKGSADGCFINTAGIGIRRDDLKIALNRIEPGDAIIVNGTIGDHGMAVMASREGLGLSGNLESDCAPLNNLVDGIVSTDIKFMRDPTRGGLATTVCEIAEETGYNVELDALKLPISESVQGIAEVLGIDPIYSANEGKVIIVVGKKAADATLEKLKAHPLGKEATIIGHVTDEKNGRVLMKTEIGTHRQVSMLSGAQLPRIC